MLTNWGNLPSMVLFLDQLHFIQRSLTYTQIEDKDDVWSIDIAK